MKIKILEKVVLIAFGIVLLAWRLVSCQISNLQKRKKRNNLSMDFRWSSQTITQSFSRFPETDKISPPLLQMNEVTFGYTPDKLILKNVNFDVGLDSRIAMVGANGAGKSTLWALSSFQ